MVAALLCKIALFLPQQWQQKMQKNHYDYKQYGVSIYDVNSMLQGKLGCQLL